MLLPRLEAETESHRSGRLSLSRRESPVLLLRLSVGAGTVQLSSNNHSCGFIFQAVLIDETIIHYGQRFADSGAR